MYIKYHSAVHGRAHVREVKHVGIRDAKYADEDGTVKAGAELYDAGYEAAAEFADAFAEYLASLVTQDEDKTLTLIGIPDEREVPSAWGVYGCEYQECAILASFDTLVAARDVFDSICAAMAAGRTFFDLTRYGSDGRVVG